MSEEKVILTEGDLMEEFVPVKKESGLKAIGEFVKEHKVPIILIASGVVVLAGAALVLAKLGEQKEGATYSEPANRPYSRWDETDEDEDEDENEDEDEDDGEESDIEVTEF